MAAKTAAHLRLIPEHGAFADGRQCKNDLVSMARTLNHLHLSEKWQEIAFALRRRLERHFHIRLRILNRIRASA